MKVTLIHFESRKQLFSDLSNSQVNIRKLPSSGHIFSGAEGLTWTWGCRGDGRICGWCYQPSVCPKSHWWRCSGGWNPVWHLDCWWWPIYHHAQTPPRESYCSRARTPPPARRTGLSPPASVAPTAVAAAGEERLWFLGCSLSCRSPSRMLLVGVRKRRVVPFHSPCAAPKPGQRISSECVILASVNVYKVLKSM